MLFPLSKLLEREDASLAPYATRSSASRGRQYPEGESEFRTPFQKDRDRILHTTAFRRLEYKTQVFVNYEGDYYRTRLTHTLEVAQVARSVAVALGAHEILTETIALSHDLGHPPFGHAGEDALDALMQGHGGFDHNRQTYRIVTELERRYQAFSGLNLCWETLEGIVKHDAEAESYPSYVAPYEPERKPSLEAQIAGMADGLAYNAHDLDDGLRAGLLHPAQLEGLPLWDRLTQKLELDYSRMTELERRIAIRELLGWAISDLILESEKRLQHSGVSSAENVRKQPRALIAHSPEMAKMMLELKAFLYQNLYYHPSKMQQTFRAEYFVEGLFRAYLKRPKMLPHNVQARFESVGLERTVCDYIAGMTDRYAMEEYGRLYAPLER